MSDTESVKARGKSGEHGNLQIDTVRIHIRLHDSSGKEMPNVAYQMHVENGIRQGQTDDEGFLKERIPRLQDRCVVQWDAARSAQGDIVGFNYTMDLFLNMGDDSDDGVQRKLHNLGYPIEKDFEANLRDFQSHHGLEVTGINDSPTKQKLDAIFAEVKDTVEPPGAGDSDGAGGDEHRT